MNTDSPHEVVYGRGAPTSTSTPRKWLPLTDAEARILEPMSPDERARWLACMPFEERLKRFQRAEREEGK